ncbi:MAG: hypothetical protein VKJ24_21330 [Synechococcales bacterium]|nr:hypothetical protein [Synechococcales bacterium]
MGFWSSCWMILVICISAGSAIAFPIATYVLTLALFGFAHVAVELRYLDSQFYPNLPRSFTHSILQGTLIIALLRSFSLLGWIPTPLNYGLELFCGIGLVIIATRAVWQQSWRLGALGIVIAFSIGIGIVKDAIATSIIFAIIHNLTPLGFILQRSRPALPLKSRPNRTAPAHAHRPSLPLNSLPLSWLCCLGFGLLPGLIFLYQWIVQPIEMLPSAMDLPDPYLSAFLAPQWQFSAIALPLFSAVTFLQCMHYAIVLGLFSQWTSNSPALRFPGRSSHRFYMAIVTISIVLFLGFQHSFLITRAFYGIVAAIHAWIEIPLLLVMLLPGQAIAQPPQAGMNPHRG